MGNPLDDALRRQDQSAGEQAANRERSEKQFEIYRQQLGGLVADFTRRMRAAGQEGADVYRPSRLKKIRGWWLIYEDTPDSNPQKLFVAEDGRILVKSQLIGAAELNPIGHMRMNEWQVERLTESMARVLGGDAGG